MMTEEILVELWKIEDIPACDDGMAVILHPEDYEGWRMRVDGESPPTNLFRPFPSDEMKAQEAHKDVGNVRNNHAE
jgi:putative SOS response-associated peptidase YedK